MSKGTSGRHHAKLFLNKVIEEGDIAAINRHNITAEDMLSEIDRNTFAFVTDYADENGGQAPSWANVADAVAGYEYLPEVSDRFTYLAREIKDTSAKHAIADWFNKGEFERKLNEMDGKEFIDNWLIPSISSVKMRTDVRETVGTDIKTDIEEFMEEYGRRKRGESFRVWESKFEAIGEYVSSNLYTVYGKSGRGKSVIMLEDALHMAQQGANVLVWAMEMGLYEVMVRAYTSLSGDMKVANGMIHGVNMDLGFNSRDIRLGQLSDDFEKALEEFLRSMNGVLEGTLTIRAVDDDDFMDRSLKALESDILTLKADVVVLDPFYYLDYEVNTSRTAGGDAAQTSMMLRRLAGHTSTVMIAITQADETSEDSDEDGSRELALPNREDVKKTKQLLEDAYQLIGVDTDYKQGRGIVGIGKGRDGGEGNVTEFIYAPNYGVVKPLETGEGSLEGFTEF